jgi:xyloglucan-specific endo-beta-1,4-glucanase
VWSYVRASNTTSLSFNIRDFINDMVSRGMQTSKYLTSVQAGTEVFVGSGTLTTTAYSTTIS